MKEKLPHKITQNNIPIPFFVKNVSFAIIEQKFLL